jgi:hypothetical protein
MVTFFIMEDKVNFRFIALLTVIVALLAVFLSGYQGVDGYVYAQDSSPVATPTVEAPPEPPVPPDPVPIPPTLLELILKVIQELGAWLTGIILLVLGSLEKEAVSWTRRRFPNDDKTATKINGGLAKVFAGLTAIVVALIAWGVAFAGGYVGGFDLGSILTLAGVLFGSGEGMHKFGKLSTIARASK